MSDGVFCPDCNSQDVQKISRNDVVVTEKYGCGHTLVGLLCFPLTFFMKGKSTTDIKTYTYYACRSCGREFQGNKTIKTD